MTYTMYARRLAVVGSAGVALAMTSGLVSSPALAATVILAPCVITVDSTRVVLRGDRAVDVHASISSCPAGAMTNENYLWWDFTSVASNSSAFTFGYESGAIYPTANMTEKLYSWYVGTYVLTPNQEDSFYNADYSTEYRTAMLANPATIVAKLGTSAGIKVKRKGKSRLITVTGKRWMQYDSTLQNAPTATIYRNGKRWKSVKLKKGKAVVTAKVPGRWSAGISETGTHWGSISGSVKK